MRPTLNPNGRLTIASTRRSPRSGQEPRYRSGESTHLFPPHSQHALRLDGCWIVRNTRTHSFTPSWLHPGDDDLIISSRSLGSDDCGTHQQATKQSHSCQNGSHAEQPDGGIARTKPTGPGWKGPNLRNEPNSSPFLHNQPVTRDEVCMHRPQGLRPDEDAGRPGEICETNPTLHGFFIISRRLATRSACIDLEARDLVGRVGPPRRICETKPRSSGVEGIAPTGGILSRSVGDLAIGRSGGTAVHRAGGIRRPEPNSSAKSDGNGNPSRENQPPGGRERRSRSWPAGSLSAGPGPALQPDGARTPRWKARPT